MSPHRLNPATLLSFCQDLNAELAETGASLPDDHPLMVEMDGLSGPDRERVDFFLAGVLHEAAHASAIRLKAETRRNRDALPSAQSYVADWQRREAKRAEAETRAVRLRAFGSRALWAAFWAFIAIVVILDRTGALDRMAGGR